jgi:cell division protein FtsN
MAQDDHKLISTPVSIADGFKRADGSTWSVLLIAAAVAVLIVVLISVFVEKPNVRWPSSPAQPTTGAQPAEQPEEPRSYDVAPPGAVPPPDKPQ